LVRRGTVGIQTVTMTLEKDDRRSLRHRNAMYNFEFDDFTGKDVDMNEPDGREEEKGGSDETLSIRKATASLEQEVHGIVDADFSAKSSLRTAGMKLDVH
ncbi:hypothetical protein U1Q18_024639, partial [Sarracenia purpurea var. burkii]